VYQLWAQNAWIDNNALGRAQPWHDQTFIDKVIAFSGRGKAQFE
jgi:hypothetical protein